MNLSRSTNHGTRRTAKRGRPTVAMARWQPAAAGTILLLVGVACSLMTGTTVEVPAATTRAEAPGNESPAEAIPSLPPPPTKADLPSQDQPTVMSALLPSGLERITVGNADKLRLVAELDTGNVLRAWFAPDTSRLAAILVGENFRTNAMGMWDLASGDELFTLSLEPWEIAFSPDGRSFALAFPTKGMEVYDSAGGDLLSSLEIDFQDAAYSPGWDRLAVSSFDGLVQTSNVRMLDRVSGSEEWSIEVENQVMGLEFSPDGRSLYGLVSHGPGADGSLMCWDADSGQTCAIPPVRGLPAFSPDGRFAAGPDEWFGQQIEVYETAGWKRVSKMGDESQPVHHISFSADGQIVGAEVGYRLRLWETLSGQELVELPDQFIDFQFSPDGRLIAAWDSLGSLKLYGVTP
jgi:WD40 repeat protein